MKRPEPPAGFDHRDIWFDLSPMRPDEFANQSAARWERAEQIKRAFERGRMLESNARKHAESNKSKGDKSIDKLKQSMGE